MATNRTPLKIEKHSPTEMRIEWSTGETFVTPFTELRFQCPCAGCVDEHSGERIIRRESVKPDVRPTSVQPVGRYAIQITWSDGHSSGIYHYDTLFEIGRRAHS